MNDSDIARDKEDVGTTPQVLFIDLEVSPTLGWTWGFYETNVLKIEQHPRIMSVAWRWMHEDETHVLGLPDFPGYKPNRFRVSDKLITRHIWELVHRADVIIGQNVKKFDIKLIHARMLAHGMSVPSPTFGVVDTLTEARKYFNMPSYKLDEILEYVGLQGKISTGGLDTWFACMNGDKEAWERMKAYNKNDVDILLPLYDKMKGWMKSHPRMNWITRKHMACPTCNSLKLRKRGIKYRASGFVQEYSCSECGKYSTGALEKHDKMELK